MTTKEEQRIWNDLERLSAVETEPVPAGRRPERRRNPAGLDEIAIGGVVIAVMLVVVGAWPVGLALGVAVALGWLMLRYGARSRSQDETDALPIAGQIQADAGRRSRHHRSLGP
jgi:uncharacterized membrane protein